MHFLKVKGLKPPLPPRFRRLWAHTHMGRPIRIYSYGTPIRIWDNKLSHIGIAKYWLIFYLDVSFLYRFLAILLHAS